MPTAPTMMPPIPASRTVTNEETFNYRVDLVTTQPYCELKCHSMSGCKPTEPKQIQGRATTTSGRIAAMTQAAVRVITCRRVPARAVAQQPTSTSSVRPDARGAVAGLRGSR